MANKEKPSNQRSGEIVFYSKTTRLTNAQIKASPTARNTSSLVPLILPTQVTNYTAGPIVLPQPILISFDLEFSTAAYTNIDPNAEVWLVYGADYSEPLWKLDDPSGAIFLATTDAPVYYRRISQAFDDAVRATAANYLDNGVYLYVDNKLLGNLTGGDDVNFLSIKITWTLAQEVE